MDTTESRNAILTKVKANRPEATELPDIPRFDIPGKKLVNFVSHLKGFDGNFQLFADRAEAEKWMQNVVDSAKGKKIVSSAKGVKGNVELSSFPTPADMNEIDVCVGEATLGVGETGSLLVDTGSLGNPAAALFSRDLYLFIDNEAILEGLQDAYSKADIAEYPYSSFFTGPSATADIEAVHITGAQGEISLTALIYNCSDSDRKDVEEIMNRLPQGTPLGQPDAPVRKMARQTDLEKGQDSV